MYSYDCKTGGGGNQEPEPKPTPEESYPQDFNIAGLTVEELNAHGFTDRVFRNK